jgi:inosose dehydratase
MPRAPRGRAPSSATPAAPERLANPGRGGEDEALRLGRAKWATLVDGVARAAEASRERGYEPVFHHHTSSYVEAVPEIERLLEDSDVELLLDSGHLAVAGGDPVDGLRDWRARIGAVHLKDMRTAVLAQVRAERADMLTAWRRGLFCALGEGDVDLETSAPSSSAADTRLGGDRAGPGARRAGRLRDAVADQQRNREWLREHAGW